MATILGVVALSDGSKGMIPENHDFPEGWKCILGDRHSSSQRGVCDTGFKKMFIDRWEAARRELSS